MANNSIIIIIVVFCCCILLFTGLGIGGYFYYENVVVPSSTTTLAPVSASTTTLAPVSASTTTLAPVSASRTTTFAPVPAPTTTTLAPVPAPTTTKVNLKDLWKLPPINCVDLNSNYVKKPVSSWTIDDRNTAIWLLNHMESNWSLEYLQGLSNELLKNALDDPIHCGGKSSQLSSSNSNIVSNTM